MGASAAILAALTLVVVLLVVRSGAGGGLAVADADAVAVVDPGKHSLLADIPVGSSPSQVTAGAGALWVANETGGTVSRIDRRTRAVSQTITVGNGPAAVAVGAGGVWVVNSLDGTLKWISPATNEVVKTIPVGDSPSGVCVTAGAVWVASTYDRSIVRFDPVTERTTTTSLDDQPTQLACGGGSLWAISQTSGTVTQLRPGRSRGSVVRRIALGRGLSGVAWGSGALWVTNTVDGTVSRIDGRSGVQTAVIALGSQSGPAGVVVSGSAVWVGNERAGTVARIDPARNAVAQTLRTGNHPQGLAVVDGALWVSVRATGAQHRGGTLHVLDTKTADGVRPTAALLDPANGYDGWGSLTLTNDGLVAFRRVGGRQSSTLVPDLAVSVPAPTDGGRTYAFQLRRGLRYSTGAAVHASDVRRGLERVLRLNRDTAFVLHGDPWRTALRGAAGALRPVLRRPGRRRRRHDHLPADRSRPGLPVQAGAAQRRRGCARRGRRRAPAGARNRARTWSPGSAPERRCGWFATRTSAPSTAGPTAIRTRSRSTAAPPGNGRSTRWGREARISSTRISAWTPSCTARSTRSRPVTPASCTPRRQPQRTTRS